MALVGIGILHMVVLGLDALAHVPGWLRLRLWTAEHWKPFLAQSPDILASNAAFWSTVGSFAIPVIIIGALVIRLDERKIEIPAFVGWGLLVWAVAASLIIETSGFPLAAAIALCLIVGVRRRNRRMA